MAGVHWYHDLPLQLEAHVYRRSQEQFARWRTRNDELATADDVAARQAEIRSAVLQGIGGLPTADTDLQPRTTGTVVGPDFDVENVIFSSLPGVLVTANLYLPRRLDQPTGGVVFLCGHSEQAKSFSLYQAVCARLARAGLVVLAVDPVGQGERKSYLNPDGSERIGWGTVEHTYVGVQCWWLGESITRYMVHDAMRAIDLLAARPEVDPARIGITGNSGGATQITWLLATEPRIAAAAPGTFVTSRRAYLWTGQPQDAEQVLPGGTVRGVDHEDLLIAAAPRAVRVLAADYDFFPIEGTIESVNRARRAYEIVGAPEALTLARARVPHGFWPELAAEGAAFLAAELGGDPEAAAADPGPPLDPVDLLCTRTGQVMRDAPDARRVFDLNVSRLPAAPPADPVRWLTARVYAHRQPAEEFFPRWLDPIVGTDGLTRREVLYRSEVDLFSAANLITDGPYTRVTIALFDRGSVDIDVHRAWIADRVAAGSAVFVLDVRGTGALTPRAVNDRPLEADCGTVFKLVSDLLWLDDSLAAARVFDVLQATGFLRTELGDLPLDLYGVGHGAFYARLAAAIQPPTGFVDLIDEPADPRAIVSQRYYPGTDRDWQLVLPGLATHWPVPRASRPG